jgi:hypothetical protein
MPLSTKSPPLSIFLFFFSFLFFFQSILRVESDLTNFFLPRKTSIVPSLVYSSVVSDHCTTTCFIHDSKKQGLTDVLKPDF